MSFLVNMAQRRLLLKFASTVPTGMVPLQNVRKALVFVDASLPCAPEAADEVRKFFSACGIELSIVCACFVRGFVPPAISGVTMLTRKDMNWTGRIRKSVALKHGLGMEDLFISLFPENPFAVEFAARSGKAVFKVGRRQCRDKVFDFVMEDGVEGPLSQVEAFRQIVGILEKVK